MMTELTPIAVDRIEAEDRVERRARLRSRIGWLALIAGAIALAWYLLAGGKEAPPPPPTPTVTVATPLRHEVTEWAELIGRFEPSRSVELRPRVSGEVTAVHFTDGEFVRAGQPLFTIDPRPYRAALAEAAGRRRHLANSDLALARSDLARAERLIEDDAVSKSEIDSLRARVTPRRPPWRRRRRGSARAASMSSSPPCARPSRAAFRTAAWTRATW